MASIDIAMESSVQEILSKMEIGVTANVVKSIQRGTFSFKQSAVISISEVNPDKSIVILNGTEDDEFTVCAYLESLSATSISLASYGNRSTNRGSYQVVEYY